MSTLLQRGAPRGLTLPSGTPRIDWGNPITRGLVGCWVPTGEGGAVPIIRDLVTQTFLEPAGSPTIQATPYGLAACDAGYAGWTAYTPTSQKPTSAFSLLWFGSLRGTSYYGYPSLLGLSYGSGNSSPYNCAAIQRTGNQFELAWNNSSSQVSPTFSTPSVSSGAYSLLGTVKLGGSYAVYLNGTTLLTGSAAAGTISYAGAGIDQIGVGVLPSSTNNYAGAGMCIGLLWNRQLTPGESATISADPTNFLIYPEDDLWSMLVGYSASAPFIQPEIMVIT